MAETTFRIVYDGPGIEDGRMDVHDLAPALLGLAETFREANTILNPIQPPVSLQIQAAPEVGSFDVGLVLAHQDVIGRIMDVFTSEPAEALLNLKEYIIGSGVGLFALIKLIRRRRIRSVQADQGVVTLDLGDGETTVIPAPVWTLYQNVRIRRRVREVIRPLERDGIDVVRFREQETTVELTKANVPDFEVPAEAEEPILDTVTTMAVSIAAPAFIEDNKWRLSDGDRTFFAGVEDAAFLQAVEDGEPFRKGDILESDVRILQTRTESGGLHTEYTVLRVHRHIPRAQPLQFRFDNDADDADADDD